GDALLLRAQAIARGLTLPVRAMGGAIVVDRAPDEVTARFSPGASARLRSRDGRVRVDFPAHAATRALTLRYRSTPLAGTASPPNVAGGKWALGAFSLDATDDTGQAVHRFDAPVTIAVGYTPEQLQARGIDAPDLTLFWFNEAIHDWQVVPTSVDPVAQTAAAIVDHFSDYTLGDGSSPSEAFIPSLQGFQVSTLTGAASYSYPIAVPPGPSGLKPSLTMSYSSAATDGVVGQREKRQAGWVGEGWSLDTGSIA